MLRNTEESISVNVKSRYIMLGGGLNGYFTDSYILNDPLGTALWIKFPPPFKIRKRPVLNLLDNTSSCIVGIKAFIKFLQPQTLLSSLHPWEQFIIINNFIKQKQM